MSPDELMTYEDVEKTLEELIAKGLLQRIDYPGSDEPVYRLTPEGHQALAESE